MALDVALSFCPNDTFIFSPWIRGYVGKELPINPTLADLDQLNHWAIEKRFPLIKVSFSCFGNIQKDYRLLSVGAALGFDCGPKVIAKEFFSMDNITKKKVALPGIQTTAHLLFDHFCPKPASKLFCRYDEIISNILKGKADCGVIIHESRFTFQNENLFEIADLGTLWQEKYDLPLPLGCLAIRNDLSQELEKKISTALQESLLYATKHVADLKDFILHHSQEKEWHIIQEHIKLYVNQETYSLSGKGRQAIEQLLCLQNLSSLPKKPKHYPQ